MQKQELARAIKAACRELFDVDIEPEITRPDEKFGDYATNAVLQMAKESGRNPRELAEKLADELRNNPDLAEVSVAGPGFINFRLTDAVLAKAATAATVLPEPLKGQTVVAEYSDPNPFKVLHIGHLYTSIVGDGIASLLEQAGAKVHRVNYGGDVGRHVAITIRAVIRKLGGELPEKLEEIPAAEWADWLSSCYVEGNNDFETDESAKSEVAELNKKIYAIQATGDKQSALARIYWTTRAWSYEYFDKFYARIGTKFEKYYPESEVVEAGMEAVKANMGKVFEQSDGAVVFKGEVHNMHTRVFVNSQGLPTYEAKEIGLLIKKEEDYHPDKSIYITGNEIYEYMQVVFKAAEQFIPELVAKTTHITHGMVKLPGGVKMSSRRGNIVRAEDVLAMVESAGEKVNGRKDPAISLGAIKYSFLKNRIGADFIFDPAESVSLEGNSGPYLQYAHARARSILQKSKAESEKSKALDFGLSNLDSSRAQPGAQDQRIPGGGRKIHKRTDAALYLYLPIRTSPGF